MGDDEVRDRVGRLSAPPPTISPTPKPSPTVARSTGDNFRLVHRLFAQITRILDVNDLSTITKEVVSSPLVVVDQSTETSLKHSPLAGHQAASGKGAELEAASRVPHRADDRDSAPDMDGSANGGV
jgi:hypothetical protein